MCQQFIRCIGLHITFCFNCQSPICFFKLTSNETSCLFDLIVALHGSIWIWCCQICLFMIGLLLLIIIYCAHLVCLLGYEAFLRLLHQHMSDWFRTHRHQHHESIYVMVWRQCSYVWHWLEIVVYSLCSNWSLCLVAADNRPVYWIKLRSDFTCVLS